MGSDLLFDGTAAIDSLSENDRHRLLASERRRIALRALRDLETPVGLADLSEEIAAREWDGRTPDQGTVKRVEITMHHLHLPIMTDLGIVDYDPYTRLVEVRVDLDGAEG